MKTTYVLHKPTGLALLEFNKETDRSRCVSCNDAQWIGKTLGRVKLFAKFKGWVFEKQRD